MDHQRVAPSGRERQARKRRIAEEIQAMYQHIAEDTLDADHALKQLAQQTTDAAAAPGVRRAFNERADGLFASVLAGNVAVDRFNRWVGSIAIGRANVADYRVRLPRSIEHPPGATAYSRMEIQLRIMRATSKVLHRAADVIMHAPNEFARIMTIAPAADDELSQEMFKLYMHMKLYALVVGYHVNRFDADQAALRDIINRAAQHAVNIHVDHIIAAPAGDGAAALDGDVDDGAGVGAG